VNLQNAAEVGDRANGSREVRAASASEQIRLAVFVIRHVPPDRRDSAEDRRRVHRDRAADNRRSRLIEKPTSTSPAWSGHPGPMSRKARSVGSTGLGQAPRVPTGPYGLGSGRLRACRSPCTSDASPIAERMTAPSGVYGPRCGSSCRTRTRWPCQETMRGSGGFTGRAYRSRCHTPWLASDSTTGRTGRRDGRR
jgi:hypothetical protein